MKKILLVLSVLGLSVVSGKEIDCNSSKVYNNIGSVIEFNEINSIENIEVKKNVSRCLVKLRDKSEKEIIVINEPDKIFIDIDYSHYSNIRGE